MPESQHWLQDFSVRHYSRGNLCVVFQDVRVLTYESIAELKDHLIWISHQFSFSEMHCKSIFQMFSWQTDLPSFTFKLLQEITTILFSTYFYFCDIFRDTTMQDIFCPLQISEKAKSDVVFTFLTAPRWCDTVSGFFCLLFWSPTLYQIEMEWLRTALTKVWNAFYPAPLIPQLV